MVDSRCNVVSEKETESCKTVIEEIKKSVVH